LLYSQQNLELKNQRCGTGSGIQDPVPFWPLDPRSRIGFFPDPGSRISDPKPYFLELINNFWGKKLYNCKLAQVFLTSSKIKICFNFVIFMATKRGITKIFFPISLLLLFLDPGSWMDKIRIRDPWQTSRIRNIGKP
jgi:hypothetical protein